MTELNKKCEVCGFPFYKEQIGDNSFIEGCSDFCARTTDEEKEAFLSLEVGEWGYFPCSECGCLMDDEYIKGQICSRCYPKVRLRERTKLLKEVLNAINWNSQLSADITRELSFKI